MEQGQRSIFRARNVILALLLAGLAWAALTVTEMVTRTGGKPGKFNAELQALSEGAQGGLPASANGWDDYVRVGTLYEEGRKKLGEAPAGWPDRFSWPPSPAEAGEPDGTGLVVEAAKADIERARAAGVLDAMESLTRPRRFVRPIPEGQALIGLLLPELGRTRALARMNKGRMVLAARSGDMGEFVAAARQTLALGGICKRQTTMIDHLVGQAVDSLVASTIRDTLREGKLTPAACGELLEALRPWRPFDALMGVKGEHLSARDIVEWTHSDDGHGDGKLVPKLVRSIIGGEARPEQTFALLFGPSKKDTLAKFSELYAAAEAQAGMTLRARQKLGEESLDVMVERVNPRYVVVRMVMPAMGRYLALRDIGEVEMAGTRVMLALEVQKAAKGAYPADLAGLDPSPESLGVPKEIASELRYRPFKPGEDPAGRGYLLYWIGLDGVDQGGKIEAAEVQAPMSRNAAGTDYILNPPPPPKKE